MFILSNGNNLTIQLRGYALKYYIKMTCSLTLKKEEDEKICTVLLTAGMLLGVTGGASAIDFKVKGQWMYSFGMVDTNFNNEAKGLTFGVTTSDTFQAQ